MFFTYSIFYIKDINVYTLMGVDTIVYILY